MTEEHNAKCDALIEKMGGLEKMARYLPVTTSKIKFALACGDNYLNTVPLRLWDKAAGLIGDGRNTFTLSFAHPWTREIAKGLSLAERVCILKRVAVRMAEKEGAAQ